MNQDLIDLTKDFSESKYEKIRQLLSENDHLRGKENPDVQASASSVVFKGNKLFFIEHPYQKELLLPAGHVELEESPEETAIREFHEETGYRAEKGTLIDVNIINIPAHPIKNEFAHEHIDFRYLLKLMDTEREEAELPTFLLNEKETPQEFVKYFKENR
ncbi:MAG: NUDIX domain-containing protein [Streptococcaceae bacterium]|nr:NUDIX domain-containing protein [Streptococcaceae bacterium]MCL2680960.1 NUDIX domain-containing protein [Streptococcaceae bacterium]